jgi:hypothetical protein
MTVGPACTALRFFSIAVLVCHCEGLVQSLPGIRKWNPLCFTRTLGTLERRTNNIPWNGGRLVQNVGGRVSRFGLHMRLGDYYDDDEVSWSVSVAKLLLHLPCKQNLLGQGVCSGWKTNVNKDRMRRKAKPMKLGCLPNFDIYVWQQWRFLPFYRLF